MSLFLSFIEHLRNFDLNQNVFLQTVSGKEGKLKSADQDAVYREYWASAFFLQAGKRPMQRRGRPRAAKAESVRDMEILPQYSRINETLSIKMKVGVYGVTKFCHCRRETSAALELPRNDREIHGGPLSECGLTRRRSSAGSFMSATPIPSKGSPAIHTSPKPGKDIGEGRACDHREAVDHGIRGDVMMEGVVVSPAAEGPQASRTRLRTGEILLRDTSLTPAQLEHCLEQQRQLEAMGQHVMLGEIILTNKYCTRRQVERAVSESKDLQAAEVPDDVKREFSIFVHWH